MSVPSAIYHFAMTGYVTAGIGSTPGRYIGIDLYVALWKAAGLEVTESEVAALE